METAWCAGPKRYAANQCGRGRGIQRDISVLYAIKNYCEKHFVKKKDEPNVVSLVSARQTTLIKKQHYALELIDCWTKRKAPLAFYHFSSLLNT